MFPLEGKMRVNLCILVRKQKEGIISFCSNQTKWKERKYFPPHLEYRAERNFFSLFEILLCCSGSTQRALTLENFSQAGPSPKSVVQGQYLTLAFAFKFVQLSFILAHNLQQSIGLRSDCSTFLGTDLPRKFSTNISCTH